MPICLYDRISQSNLRECTASNTHTHNNYKSNPVRQQQHATEGVELWLDSRITVRHGIVLIESWRPYRESRPSVVPLSQPSSGFQRATWGE